MFQNILKLLRSEMLKTIDLFEKDLQSLRTGKASSALIEGLMVSYYSSHTPLKQLANISIPDSNLIVIQPWDINSLGDIEIAIENSNLNLKPTNDGRVIRLTFPPMTAERREEIVKLIHQKAEEIRVNLRNLREESWREIQKMEKLSKITEDDYYQAEKELNNLIKDNNQHINDMVTNKEKEIRSI
jgi:ribosome recycling factor